MQQRMILELDAVTALSESQPLDVRPQNLPEAGWMLMPTRAMIDNPDHPAWQTYDNLKALAQASRLSA